MHPFMTEKLAAERIRDMVAQGDNARRARQARPAAQPAGAARSARPARPVRCAGPRGGAAPAGRLAVMAEDGDAAPQILDLPIGLSATGTRAEFDSLGRVEVQAGRYWGAQTQRSLEHFSVGHDKMPAEVYHAYGYVKKAAALVNTRSGRLPGWMGQLIQRVCDEIIRGDLDSEFPLHVFQTGSGTHSNMNVNEVIANRCIQLAGGTLGSQQPVHPNDHVNMAQSSNDTFPTAMHIAAYTMATGRTIPALRRLRDAIAGNAEKWAGVVKIGRTHLQDATPLTVGQEWSGYAGALGDAIAEVSTSPAACWSWPWAGPPSAPA